MNLLVCSCAQVHTEDISNLMMAYPGMNDQQIKAALHIGRTCGACNFKDCDITEISFESAMKIVRTGKNLTKVGL